MASPIVTFALFAYNQERFIREAVEGALAQTYSPLEIILTDDCSPDRTFEIMQEMAASYRGPHQIHVNRAHSNRGVSAQIDAAVKLVKGEWIVVAAGDDISLPNRVAEHMAIAAAHPDAYSSFLAPLPFGESAQGRVPLVDNRIIRYPESLKAHGGGVLGATHAFRASLWKVFGDLGAGIIAEDWVIPFRSSLLGCVVWSDRPGVRYRIHGESIGRLNFGAHVFGRQLRVEWNAQSQCAKDLLCAIRDGIVSSESTNHDLRWLGQAINSNRKILDCFEANTFWALLRACGQLLASRHFVVGNYRRRLSLVLAAFHARYFVRAQGRA